MSDFAGPAIPMSPKQALWADFTLGIIHSLFVWTAQYTICHSDGFRSMLLNKNLNGVCDGQIGADIPIL
jgi:hypothetical protein